MYKRLGVIGRGVWIYPWNYLSETNMHTSSCTNVLTSFLHKCKCVCTLCCAGFETFILFYFKKASNSSLGCLNIKISSHAFSCRYFQRNLCIFSLWSISFSLFCSARTCARLTWQIWLIIDVGNQIPIMCESACWWWHQLLKLIGLSQHLSVRLFPAI